MKKFLFLTAIMLPIIASCSSSDNDEVEPSLDLDRTELSIPVNGEVNIKISGADPKECKASSENEFVAYPLILGENLNINADHVGETKIVVKYKNQTKECNVTVEPLTENILGNPALNFGCTKKELKAIIKGEIIEETNTCIEVKEQAGNTYYHTYHFSDNELECIMTFTYAREDYLTIVECLRERYETLTLSGKYVWYEYPGRLIARMWLKDGNGGYQVEYATDKKTLSKYYQVD